MARLLLLDVYDDVVKEVKCDALDDFYKYLRCEYFEIPNRSINGKRYDIYCDENGNFVDQPIVSAFNSEDKPMLVGNLIFANHDAEGNTTSLSDNDIAWIKENICGAAQFSKDGELIHIGKALANCDY